MAFPSRKRIKRLALQILNLFAPSGYMPLGINATWVNSWENVAYFANLARVVGNTSWELVSGTGTAITTSGKIQPSNTSSIWRAYLSDSGEGIPSGVYTVRWTGVGSVKLDGFTTPDSGWNTSGSFTFNYTKGNFLGVFFKGTSLTSLQILQPNMVTSYDAGNEWSTSYLSWFASTGIKALRGMDWITTSENFEQEWSDRSTLSDIGWGKETTASGVSVPYELQIDFANRLGIDIWMNIPTRASTSYASSLGALIKANLNPNLKAYLELGNEIWNTSYPWGDNTSWIRYLYHTRLTCVGSSPNILTKTAHGLTNSSQIVFFQRHGESKDPAWELSGGNICNVTVVDANSFTVKAVYGAGTTPNTSVGKQYTYIVVGENNNTVLGTNYSTRYQQLITAMKPSITRSQIYFVMGAQQYNVGDASLRMQAISDLNDFDFLAVAPYSNGCQWGVKANISVGGVTPQVCTTENYVNIHWGVYPFASSPSNEVVMAGTGSLGSGAISGSTYLPDYVGSQAVTGLSTSATYKIIAVAIHDVNIQLQTRIEITFIPSAVSSVEQSISNAQKALVDELNLITEYSANNGNSIEEHVAIARGKPVIAYEGGPHEDRTRPASINSALFSYFSSSDFSTVFERTLSQFAIKGLNRFFFYKDISKTNWGLSRYTSDLADRRYLSYKSFSGNVPKYTQLANIADSSHTVPSLPALPYNIRTLLNTSGSNTLDSGVLSYEIISGNSAGRFSIQGSVLQLSDASGISWSAHNAFRLVIRSSNKYTVDYGIINIVLGI